MKKNILDKDELDILNYFDSLIINDELYEFDLENSEQVDISYLAEEIYMFTVSLKNGNKYLLYGEGPWENSKGMLYETGIINKIENIKKKCKENESCTYLEYMIKSIAIILKYSRKNNEINSENQ